MPACRRFLVPALLLIGLSAAVAHGGEPAKIVLAEETRSDGSWALAATVSDGAGEPVEGVAVTFAAPTAFGSLRLAEIDTDAAGIASLSLPAVPPYREVQASADAGTPLAARLRLDRPPAPGPARRPGPEILRAMSPQPGLLSPYPPVQILFVVVLLGAIWTTYAYLVSLLLGIRRAP